MSMYLGWLKCFMWVIFLHTVTSFHEGPNGNYSAIANSSAKLNNSEIPDFSVRPYPNNCACHDHLGKIYNLQPLQSTDGTASFTVHSKKYPGYRYTFNPCSSFELGPLDGGCRWDVAICWWVPKGLPDTYKTIGNQRKARCQFDKDTKRPILMYKSSDFPYRKVKIKLQCDERKKDRDEAIFEILDEDEWIFQLTHKCACGDGCPIYPNEPTTTEYIASTSPDPFDPNSIEIPIAVSAGTIVIFLVPFLVWLAVKRQNRNNDEQQNLLGDGAGNQQQINNPIQGRSQPMPIGPSPQKADVNVTSAHV